jgi:drug/metabolite transporter (DMT)-like permease
MRNPVQFVHPYWIVLVGVISISCSAIFIKLASAPAIVTAFYRMLFTVIMLTPFLLWRLVRQRGQWRLTVKQLVTSSVAGGFLALHFAFWITSLNYTSITSSTVLVTLQPLFVMGGGYLLYQERVGHRALIGAMVSICGGIVLGYGDIGFGPDTLYGDLLALAGSLLVACYLLIGRNVRQRVDVLPYTYLVYLSAAIVLFLGNAILTQQPLTGYSEATWGWFVAMALVPNILGHSIFSWALKYVSTAVVSVSILGEPVGATILTFFIWHLLPGTSQVLGGLLIVAGLTIFIVFSQRTDESSIKKIGSRTTAGNK